MTQSVLFKNLTIEHLESFKREGTVKVGTLYYYRDIEDMDRKDATEGRKGLYLLPNERVQIPIEQVSKWTEGMNVSIKSTGVAQVSFRCEPGSNFTLETQLPNAYVFCVSEKIDLKFGGAHYRITDLDRFGELILSAIKQVDDQVFCAAWGSVIYGGIKDPLRAQIEIKRLGDFRLGEREVADFFCKPSRYQDEAEVRFVFFSARAQLEPTFICAKELTTCCDF